MRISDWSSDVCSSDLRLEATRQPFLEFGKRRIGAFIAVRERGAEHARLQPRRRIGARRQAVVEAGGEKRGGHRRPLSTDSGSVTLTPPIRRRPKKEWERSEGGGVGNECGGTSRT